MASAKLEDRIRESLTARLEPGEQLRAVGEFQSGGDLRELPKATFFVNRNWWVGITDRRAILAKQSYGGKLLENQIFSVPRENVAVKGGVRRLHLTRLRITSPERKVPKVLRSMPSSRDEFTKALGNGDDPHEHGET